MKHLPGIEAFVTKAVTASDALPDDAAWADRARGAIAGSARLSPAEQLEIYREQFWSRHVGSLEDDFVVARHLLGEAGFRDLARAFLETHPPSTYDLRALGRELPAFAASRAPYASDPRLLGAMRLDWAFMEAFDAPSCAPFDASVLASIGEDDWPKTTIALHPSLRLVSLDHPLAPLRDAIRRDELSPETETLAAARAPSHVLVYRRGESLRWMEAAPAAHALLAALARGDTLGDACEAAARALSGDVDEIGQSLGAWFQTWTSEGLIARVSVPVPVPVD